MIASLVTVSIPIRQISDLLRYAGDARKKLKKKEKQMNNDTTLILMKDPAPVFHLSLHVYRSRQRK